MTDRPKLISLLSSTKPNDLLVLSVNSLDKNSYRNFRIEIDKFMKKSEDYVVIALRK